VAPTLTVGAKWLGQKAHPHRRRFIKPTVESRTRTCDTMDPTKDTCNSHHSSSRLADFCSKNSTNHGEGCTRLALKFTVHMGQIPCEHKPFAAAAQCMFKLTSPAGHWVKTWVDHMFLVWTQWPMNEASAKFWLTILLVIHNGLQKNDHEVSPIVCFDWQPTGKVDSLTLFGLIPTVSMPMNVHAKIKKQNMMLLFVPTEHHSGLKKLMQSWRIQTQKDHSNFCQLFGKWFQRMERWDNSKFSLLLFVLNRLQKCWT